MIQIEDTKLDKMSGMVEEALSVMGKLMSCLEECAEEGYGERMGYRGGNMGYRDEYGRYGMGERRRSRY